MYYQQLAYNLELIEQALITHGDIMNMNRQSQTSFEHSLINIAESSVFLSLFNSSLEKLEIHDLLCKINQYLPNLSSRVQLELNI